MSQWEQKDRFRTFRFSNSNRLPRFRSWNHFKWLSNMELNSEDCKDLDSGIGLNSGNCTRLNSGIISSRRHISGLSELFDYGRPQKKFIKRAISIQAISFKSSLEYGDGFQHVGDFYEIDLFLIPISSRLIQEQGFTRVMEDWDLAIE